MPPIFFFNSALVFFSLKGEPPLPDAILLRIRTEMLGAETSSVVVEILPLYHNLFDA